MHYCRNCLLPFRAVNLQINEKGQCSACDSHERYSKIKNNDWAARKEKFKEIIIENKKNSNSDYDCIIPVSGGKDSYFQTHDNKRIRF